MTKNAKANKRFAEMIETRNMIVTIVKRGDATTKSGAKKFMKENHPEYKYVTKALDRIMMKNFKRLVEGVK